VSLLELVGLSSLAVAQPLLDVFGRNASVFVVQSARPRDVILFGVALTLGPSLLLWAVEVVVGAVSDRARLALHAGFIGLLGAVFATVVMKRTIDSFDFWSDYKRTVASFLAGGLLVAAYLRFAPVRSWLRYLAVAAPVFLLTFLLASQAATIVNPTDLPEAASIHVTRPAPVVMIILDELPTKSILDGRGGVDRDLFPGFGELAGTATWYRNNTTVAPLTPEAIPPILTGRYADHDALPVAAEYPRNLFSLLRGTYDIHASEAQTRLCPSRCGGSQPSTARVLRSLATTASDVWRGLAEPWSRPAKLNFDVGNAIPNYDPALQAEHFIDSLAVAEKPRFDFLHLVLPHHGFRFTPSGDTYLAPVIPMGLDEEYRWSDAGLADETRRRHLLQLQYTDHLLQRIFQRLRDLGTYDESLVIVTADHGISFTEGEALRAITPGNHDDIMWVPLLIKAPGQRAPRVVDEPTRSIDIVPTIASTLGVDIPWEIDGVAASEARPASYARPRILNLVGWSAELEGDYVTTDGDEGYREVLAAGPPSTRGDPRLRLFRRGPYADLVGRRVDELGLGPEMPISAELAPGPELVVEGDEPFAPVVYDGRMPAGPRLEIAVAVNGRIGTVTGVFYGFGLRIFNAVVPEHLLRNGRNDVRLFAVEGNTPTLRPIRASPLTS
jgi:hypothetical protein